MNLHSSVITLQDVDFFAPSGKKEHLLLHQLNLEIRQGEWVAIAGASGCGKSTLARVLAGLPAVYNGTIRVSAEAMPVGLIMQNPDAQLVGETVLEDVTFGLEQRGHGPDQILGLARAALARVGLLSLENRPVTALSGGQKQLLAIAGALAVDVPALILDEATSMLDPASREEVLAILSELHRAGRTIIMTTQLMDELALADRIIVLHNHELCYNGNPVDFFYGEKGQGPSMCEKLGFQPTFTVRTAQWLIRQGVEFSRLPLLPEELTGAVYRRC